jgi:hypothetical protein
VRKYRIGAAEFEIVLVDGGLVDAQKIAVNGVIG